MFQNYCEQIFSLQTGQYALLVRRNRSRIAVVHDQCSDRRSHIVERFTQLTHVDRAGIAPNKIPPLESRIVELKKTTGAQDCSAARISPRANERRQTENIAHRHCAASMSLQPVIHAD